MIQRSRSYGIFVTFIQQKPTSKREVHKSEILVHSYTKKNIYIMLLYDSRSPTYVPKSQLFQRAWSKIYVPMKFGFWENWLCRLIELIEYI